MAPISWENSAIVNFKGQHAKDSAANQVQIRVAQMATAETGVKDHAALNFYYEKSDAPLAEGATPLLRIQHGTTDDTTGDVTQAKKVQFDGQDVVIDSEGTATMVADARPASLLMDGVDITGNRSAGGTEVFSLDVDGGASNSSLTLGPASASVQLRETDSTSADVVVREASKERASLLSKASEGALVLYSGSADGAQTAAAAADKVVLRNKSGENVLTAFSSTVVNSSGKVPTAALAETSGSAVDWSSYNPTVNNMTVAGDLTVQGTTTTIDATNLVVEDPVIKLGEGSATLTSNDSKDRALVMKSFTDAGKNIALVARTKASGTIDTLEVAHTVDDSLSAIGGTLAKIKVANMTDSDGSDLLDGLNKIPFSRLENEPALLNGNSAEDFAIAAATASSLSVGTVGNAGSAVVISDALEPSVDNSKALGSSSKRWSDIRAVAGTIESVTTGALSISSGGTVLPAVANNVDLGSDAKRFKQLNAMTVDASTSVSTAAVHAGTIDNSGASISVGDSLLPDVDGALALGSSSKRWSDIRASAATIGNISATTVGAGSVHNSGASISVGDSLVPDADGSLALGTASARWSDVQATQATLPTLVTSSVSNSGSSISVGDSLVPGSGSVALGTSSQKWADVQASAAAVDSLTASSIANGGSSISLGDSLVPSGSVALGSSSNKWSDMQASAATIDSLQASSIAVDGSISVSGKNASFIKHRGIFASSLLISGGFANGDPSKYLLLGRFARNPMLAGGALYATSNIAAEVTIYNKRFYHKFFVLGSASTNTPASIEYICGSGDTLTSLKVRMISPTGSGTSSDEDDYLLVQFQGTSYGYDTYVDVHAIQTDFEFADASEVSGYQSIKAVSTVATPRALDNTNFGDGVEIDTAGTITYGNANRYNKEINTLEVIGMDESTYRPKTNNTVDLGSSTRRFKNLYAYNVDATSSVTVTSDERHKEEIQPLARPENVLQVRAKQFVYKEDSTKRKRAGFIAQEVETVMPEAVMERDGRKALDPVAVVAYLWNEVADLNEQVQELKKRKIC